MNVRTLKPVVFLLALTPFALLVWDGFHDALSANPVEEVTHRTGGWALRFLLITLAVTPLRILSGWREVIRYRRMLGLFAFFYATLHVLTYVFLDLGLYWAQIAEDVVKRPYITVGFTAFVLLVPLAVTSTRGMMRRLGRNWQRLHRTVYVIGVLGVLHFLWLVKADLREPLIYAAILALLLGLRVWRRYAVGARPGLASAMSPAPRSSTGG